MTIIICPHTLLLGVRDDEIQAALVKWLNSRGGEYARLVIDDQRRAWSTTRIVRTAVYTSRTVHCMASAGSARITERAAAKWPSLVPTTTGVLPAHISFTHKRVECCSPCFQKPAARLPLSCNGWTGSGLLYKAAWVARGDELNTLQPCTQHVKMEYKARMSM